MKPWPIAINHEGDQSQASCMLLPSGGLVSKAPTHQINLLAKASQAAFFLTNTQFEISTKITGWGLPRIGGTEREQKLVAMD